MSAVGKRIEIAETGRVVAANVRNLRAARRMTRDELVERLTRLGRPIPLLGIARIEKLERRVDVDDLAALAEVFGVTTGQLLEPAPCDQCHGAPPAGFSCNACGTGSAS